MIIYFFMSLLRIIWAFVNFKSIYWLTSDFYIIYILQNIEKDESLTNLNFDCRLETLVCFCFGVLFVPEVTVYRKPTLHREVELIFIEG